MYEFFYNLKSEPFRLSPDHQFCYAHDGYTKAKAYMAYAFVRAEGFVMITGRPGTGKTTLIGDLIESLADERVTTATLVCTQLEADDLLRMVAFSFGMDVENQQKSQVLQQLVTLFTRYHQRGHRALLIVDEAQDLSESALEELRLLTNLQVNGEPLLQIFLLGQEELRELVQRPSMTQVQQRIVATCNLQALRVDETREYILHRLLRVGWSGRPALSEALYPIIHRFSEGVPRRINLICSRLFLHGSVEQREQIAVADARAVISELQMEQLAAGSLLSDVDFTAEDDFVDYEKILTSLGYEQDMSCSGGEVMPSSDVEQPESGEDEYESLVVVMEEAGDSEYMDLEVSTQQGDTVDEVVLSSVQADDAQALVAGVSAKGAAVDNKDSPDTEIASEEPFEQLVEHERDVETKCSAESVQLVVVESKAGADGETDTTNELMMEPGKEVASDAMADCQQGVTSPQVASNFSAVSGVVWGLVTTLAVGGLMLCAFYWQFVWS